MNYITIKTGGIKFVLGWLAVFLIRLIPFRPPNFEPMLAAVMPYSKKYNLWGCFLFGFLGIVLFDLASNRIGMWTLITACAYGLLGIASYFFFKKRRGEVKNFVLFGVIGTILYDAVTGLSIGPLFFGQSVMEAFVGQIPFTLMHVLGTVTFALVLSPALYWWVVQNDSLDFLVSTKQPTPIS